MPEGPASNTDGIAPPRDAIASFEVPRGRFAGLTLAGAVLGVGIAFGLAFAFGGGRAEATSGAMVVAVAAGIGFGPALLRVSAQSWGLVVLVSGMLRAMLCYAGASMAMSNNPDLLRRPLFLAVMAAAVLMLIVETMAAVGILGDIDRKKNELKQRSPAAAQTTTASGPKPVPMEHA